MFFLIANFLTALWYPELKKPEPEYLPQHLLFNKYHNCTLDKLLQLKRKDPENITQKEKDECTISKNLIGSGKCFGISIFWAVDKLEDTDCFYRLSNLLSIKFNELTLSEKQYLEIQMQKIIASHGYLEEFKKNLSIRSLLEDSQFVPCDPSEESIAEADNWNTTFISGNDNSCYQIKVVKKILEGDYIFNTVVFGCAFEYKSGLVLHAIRNQQLEEIMSYNFKKKHPGIMECSVDFILFVHCADEVKSFLNSATKKVILIDFCENLNPSNESEIDVGHVVSMSKNESGIFQFFDCNNSRVEKDINFDALAEKCLKPHFVWSSEKQTNSYNVYEILKDDAR